MAFSSAQQSAISSPDGKYTIAVDGMTYSVTYNDKVIIERSQMGVDIDNRLFESALGVPRGVHENWCGDLQLKGEERTSADTTWIPLYGENAQIRDHYNQLTLHYEKGSNGQGTVAEGYDKRKYYAMDIVIRAYDEGIAFRYHFPETANSLFLHITGEQTSFTMPRGTMAWYEEWHTAADITRVKANLGVEPFKSAYAQLETTSGGTAAGAVEYLKRMDQANFQTSSFSAGKYPPGLRKKVPMKPFVPL